MIAIASWRWIRDPEVELKASVARLTNGLGPLQNLFGLHEERAARAEPAGIRDCDRELGRTRAGHRREEDGHADVEASAEGCGASAEGQKCSLHSVDRLRWGRFICGDLCD